MEPITTTPLFSLILSSSSGPGAGAFFTRTDIPLNSETRGVLPNKHDFFSHVFQPILSPGQRRGFFSLERFPPICGNRAGCGLTPYGQRERPSQMPGIPMPGAAASPPSTLSARLPLN